MKTIKYLLVLFLSLLSVPAHAELQIDVNGAMRDPMQSKIGRASCRERV